ncbi:carbon starvation CstA family protein [Tuwongella immobilis]|uniref:CstA N-terminal domain-containing protein n=1 Tax=Tuwongella immobilis TaxID=692036 RepID=A0A6C2YJL6_9BACT|nr:carbon starvation protein A [Tuwongella immobilis]VIP01567.1 carbon starvation protein : Carbon starvation protein CstA OS=uncultured planctomycete GN=HGMM_F09D09C24 PE=4 SV=1: CstA: CstA: DUF4161 [Tuwongella immobilis]VTR98792.1 carbon starvation protein : Carbon starvation protein CstA OS=uncultured planctomycete GN=HGMM_F09D09C24 PE=4 SV=1: CstA: CstA: DUF4161 [Tuwongella immobilis]
MLASMFAGIWYEIDPVSQRTLYHAMPIMLGVLCILAIAYRYYSAFLAAKVMALDDSRVTPAHRLNDGQNYHPTNKWVLFGHHFAAISGAGPLIGPVLAIQYGYAPGLLWLVIGVCLAGAAQDMLVLAASVRNDGKSLAEIARREIGPRSVMIVSVAILFIVVIALAGLGMIIVKALGGESVKLPAAMQIVLPADQVATLEKTLPTGATRVRLPAGCGIRFSEGRPVNPRPESFLIEVPAKPADAPGDDRTQPLTPDANRTITLPKGCKQIVPGSSWGTFTIVSTIPIALLVGLWMYRIRPGKIIEASAIGVALVLLATVAGAWIPGSALEPYFSMDRDTTIWALCGYGFVASVLPVWLLLGPRDYLSSFLKIGTILLLVVGVVLANPTLKSPPINETFLNGGPTLDGNIFPFVFICIMCGAISGFHTLVSSGTTPKMITRERDIRPIGYGAMLMEGLVGLVALIAAASMPPTLYYDINVDLDRLPAFEQRLQEMHTRLGTLPGAQDPMHAAGVRDLHNLNLGEIETMVGGESLRGRTGGAVTLAVSMAMILTDAFRWADANLESLMKYWYHFAIMFEALFILTTIDAGTRVARFLMQETVGRVSPPFARTNWLPGALLCSGAISIGYGVLISSGSIDSIWPMFGIANQLLAVMALAIVTTLIVNRGRARYMWVTVLPMLFVTTTTLTAGTTLITQTFPARMAAGVMSKFTGYLNIGLTLFVITSVMAVVVMAAVRWIAVIGKFVPTKLDEPPTPPQTIISDR